MVVEQYYNGSTKADSLQIASITKSIISALTGIAIQKGHIKNPQQKLSDLLLEYFTTEANQPKKDITLKHLLTMSAGFEPSAFQSRTNWVREAIDMPLRTKPGTYFWYNSALPHILSVLISRTSGMSTCEFAYRDVFDPLGITADDWTRDPQGYFMGAAGVYLTPRELARFGLLYLRGTAIGHS